MRCMFFLLGVRDGQVLFLLCFVFTNEQKIGRFLFQFRANQFSGLQKKIFFKKMTSRIDFRQKNTKNIFG